jgi:hypothetical protein
MTKEALKQSIAQLESELESKKTALIVEYCKANNPYKIGDEFTDYSGTIIIDKIKYSIALSANGPCCVYYGQPIRKNGSPRKSIRKAWQHNEIKSTHEKSIREI